MVKICLDAGHGGKDSGATGNGLLEKDLTLDIIKRIAEGLTEYEDVQLFLTRNSDVFVELSERANIANRAKCDLFLSVHINSGAASAKGFESYIYTKVDAGTKAFQNVMHQEVYNAAYSNMTDRGKKQADFAVIRESDMKAILTENLFISNSSDAAYLNRSDNRQKIAQGHINGIVKFLGLKKKQNAQPPPAAGKLYLVQVGAFEQKKNAEALAADLQRQGYRPIIKYE